MKRALGMISFALAFLLCGHAGGAQSFDADLRDGHFMEASTQLSSLPAGGPGRGEAIDKMLTVLPLLQWSPETEQGWTNCLAAIETETNAYWATRNLGSFVGAAASPSVPRNPATAAMLERAAVTARRWTGQGAPLVVAQGLLWYGDFPRAYAMFPNGETPEPLVEFSFETLADKPELGKQDALWTLALGHLGSDPAARHKAIHALAFSGRLGQALAIAASQSEPGERVADEILAARYARYGGHDSDFAQAMAAASGDLHLLPASASALLLLRNLLQETTAPPVPVLPDTFWKTVDAWAGSQPPDVSSAAVAEIAGASAWAGRPDASALLSALSGTSWQDSARMRVACGWLWNGKHDQAAACAAAIKDPEWRALADREMAYLTRQMTGGEAAK